ncbi:MAG: type II CRISPR RNA-guided endonuclease Cas9 [Eubacterium ramulus]
MRCGGYRSRWCRSENRRFSDEMYLSAPVKRVWFGQTIRVVDEVQQIMGCPPKRIFVEMTRSDGEKGKRTVSRQKKLLDLYKALGKEGKTWSEELNNTPEGQFRIKKLYLYYLQMGKCMYTGESIELEPLMNDNHSWK